MELKPVTFSHLPVPVRQMVQSFLQEGHPDTPVLLFSAQRLLENVRAFFTQLPVHQLYFPVKVNNHPGVLTVLKQAGLSFEIASFGELELLLALHIPASSIFFGNPIGV